LGGSRVDPGQVPGRSWAGPSQVLGGSRAGLGQVPSESWTSPGRVSIKSQVGLGRVSVKSRVGPRRVSGKSWAGPDQVSVGSRVSLGGLRQFKNEMLKIGNWFTVLKTVNHFPKIKEEFSVKEKMFSVDYYFTSQ
jgi:hypothetical protein